MERKKVQIIDASDPCCFWCNDGRILRNLYDLAKALDEMSDEVFKYHANNEKNDFSNWVGEVLLDPGLAKALKSAKSKDLAARKVRERIRETEKK